MSKTDSSFSKDKRLNRLPLKIRLLCMKHNCRLKFVKKFGGYICSKEGYCSVVRVINLL